VVAGVRLDGLLAARVGPVEITVAEGAAETLTLRFPTARTGGIGVTIAPSEDGVRVVRVIPGGPADRAGLEEGDVIVAVEGASTAGMSADDFIARMTGPEDTPVQFTLATLGDTGLVEEVVEAMRAFVDHPAP
jgi:C-terminal processing protease CtpA/Prc